jgi:hypothetical protein
MKHSKHGKWIFGEHYEIFSPSNYYNTKEEAIQAGKGFENEFYVGQVVSVEFATTPNVDAVIESIAQNVYDEVGEVAEDYLNHIDKEHLQELEDGMSNLVSNWMNKHGYTPDFFKVVNIEKVSK